MYSIYLKAPVTILRAFINNDYFEQKSTSFRELEIYAWAITTQGKSGGGAPYCFKFVRAFPHQCVFFSLTVQMIQSTNSRSIETLIHQDTDCFIRNCLMEITGMNKMNKMTGIHAHISYCAAAANFPTSCTLPCMTSIFTASSFW